YIAALQCFKAAENRGDIEAEAMIGVMTFKGLGMKADQRAGLEMLGQTAKAGSEVGQFSLAKIYSEGVDGIPKNLQMAAMWKAAAERTAQERERVQAVAAQNARMAQMTPQQALLLLLFAGTAASHGAQAGSSDSAWSNSVQQQSRAEETERENT